MAIIITYDLDKRWTEVKQAALASGFYDYVISDAGTRIQLPNTTLQVDAPTPQQASDRFIAVVRSTDMSIVIERSAAFYWTNMTSYADPRSSGTLGSLLAR